MTDHKPLLEMFKMKDPSPRQWRHIEYLSRYSLRLEYIPGTDNVVADWLSRPDGQEIIGDMGIASLFAVDPHCGSTDARVHSQLLAELQMSSLRPTQNSQGILVDRSSGRERVLLQKSSRREQFERLHNLAHPGGNRTIALVSARYVWPGLRADVRQWCRTCKVCQRNKVGRHTRSAPGEFEPAARFSDVHVDLVGPMPSARGQRYLLTMIDRNTSWVEAEPLSEATAESVTEAFVSVWVARFGVPNVLITDQGRQFDSVMFLHMCNRLGIKKRRTTAYHPECNGKVERWHRTLKNALRCKVEDTGRTWLDELPLIMLALRNTSTADFGQSPAMKVFGEAMRLPGDKPRDRPTVERGASSSCKKGYVSPDLHSCRSVWLRTEGSIKSALEPPYSGPYDVIERRGKVFKLQLAAGQRYVTIDRLKPAK
jgi:transposase InsO family protein